MAVGVVVGVVRECGGECFGGSGCSALVRWIWLCGGYGGECWGINGVLG